MAMAEDEEMVEAYSGIEGRLVEIFDMEYTYARTLANRERDRKLVNINGQIARCGAWLSEEQKFAVQTFEGTWAAVPEEFLREADVPSAEDGGFDLLWPADEQNVQDMADFAEMAAHCVARKGYCVVQMFTSIDDRRDATEAAELCPDLRGSLRREIESAYVGYNNTTQMCSVGQDDGSGEVDEGDSLGHLKRQFSLMWMAIAPCTPMYMGFSANSWSTVWARPYDEDARDDSRSFGTQGGQDDDSMVENYDQFLAGRTVCGLHMLNNSGGEIRLSPRQGEVQEIILPVNKNRLLLFRHDLMSYAYMPNGPSVALQGWLMASASSQIDLQSNIVAKLTGVREAPKGRGAQIMTAHMRMPGSVDSAAEYWQMFVTGTDTNTQWPVTRWPTEPYYTSEDNWTQVFKSYTKHGAFMDQEEIERFDAKFFGFGHEAVAAMVPGQRLVLECGYTAVMQGGHTRASMSGENIGFFLGDVGADWHAAAAPWSETSHYNGIDTITNHDGIHVAVTANRFSHLFNLVGPTLTVDTACSASLVALQAGHKQMMHTDTDQNQKGSVATPHSILNGGVNTLLTPMSFVGNCMASMLSHVGRCWTFDRTADGYQRGEGCAFMYIKWSGDELDFEERLAALIGTCSNHDGRSASLTAPNGPSQQLCIRLSMRMADVDPSKISIAECHGTGTALGDPIEVGALQGVMRGLRDFPLFNTSAKTNISHLEAGAGCAGITKCVQMVISSCAPPNCSLRVLNPNLEQTMHDGYPVYFEQELSDTNFTTTCLGVSSFGFGGTNSRADIYGRCLRGPRDTGNIWTAERLAARNEAYQYGLRNSYKGALPDEPTRERNIFMVGTWNAYNDAERMWCSSPGCYVGRVTLGDTRWEKFQLLLNGDTNQPLYPSVDCAGCSAIIRGPDEYSQGKQWLLDGRDQCVSSGTTYRITLEWKGSHKSISWAVEAGAPDTRPYVHRYDLVNPTTGASQEMALVSEEDGLYETTLRITNMTGISQFQFIRDKDRDQAIYPAMHHTTDMSVPVRGPDNGNTQNYTWLANGDFGEEFKVQLRVVNGKISVILHSQAGVPRIWQNASDPVYYVSGSFNDWQLTAMVSDRRLFSLFRYHLIMGDSEHEEFLIMVDQDGTGEVAAIARLDGDVDEPWRIDAKPGTSWEILLDLNQDDPRKRIYWRKSTSREQHLVA